MYEAQTYESILARMLQKALSINSNLDTREGSLGVVWGCPLPLWNCRTFILPLIPC